MTPWPGWRTGDVSCWCPLNPTVLASTPVLQASHRRPKFWTTCSSSPTGVGPQKKGHLTPWSVSWAQERGSQAPPTVSGSSQHLTDPSLDTEAWGHSAAAAWGPQPDLGIRPDGGCFQGMLGEHRGSLGETYAGGAVSVEPAGTPPGQPRWCWRQLRLECDQLRPPTRLSPGPQQGCPLLAT